MALQHTCQKAGLSFARSVMTWLRLLRLGASVLWTSWLAVTTVLADGDEPSWAGEVAALAPPTDSSAERGPAQAAAWLAALLLGTSADSLVGSSAAPGCGTVAGWPSTGERARSRSPQLGNVERAVTVKTLVVRARSSDSGLPRGSGSECADVKECASVPRERRRIRRPAPDPSLNREERELWMEAANGDVTCGDDMSAASWVGRGDASGLGRSLLSTYAGAALRASARARWNSRVAGRWI